MATVSVPISAGGNDGFISGASGYFPSEAQVAFGESAGNALNAWFYFAAVAIPDGQVILDAYLKGRSTGTLLGSVSVRLYAEDADDPSAPTSIADYNSRTLTSASRAWAPEPFSTGEEYRSPNLAQVIQEVYDRDGWESGNAIGILIKDDGSSNVRTFAALEHTTLDPVELVIEYIEQSDPNVYYTDFTHNTANAAPSDWQPEWGADDAGMVVLDSGLPSGATGGKALQLTRTVSASDAYSYLPPGTPTGDVQVWARIRRTGGVVHPALLHGSGTNASKTGYSVRTTTADPGQTVLTAQKSNVQSNLETGGPGIDFDTWFEILLERTGTTIRAKVWESGTSEPGEWNMSQTDADLSSGWIGALMGSAGVELWVDQFGVGVGGSDAPRETPPNPGERFFPEGISSSEAFGTPTLDMGNIDIEPAGIESSEAFGTPSLNLNLSLNPDGIESSEAFGTPTITRMFRLRPEGIPSSEAFGSVTLDMGVIELHPDGIESTEAFGTPTLDTTIRLTPEGIPSSEAFGTPTLLMPITLHPEGIPSSEAFGTPTIDGVIPTVFIVHPGRMPGPPRFDLVITGPLPTGGFVSRLGLPEDLALSFGSELPGGWATADIGVVDDPWRVPPDYLRMMTLPDATSAPPFAHIEIREAGTGRVWEGRLGSRQRHAGELRGIRALGYGITGLRDGRMPAGNGPASARAVVLRALDAWAYPTPRGSSAVQPILVAGQIADTGVMHDWSEFAGRQPYDALDAIAQAGNATWTVYARQLRFFVLTPPSEPDYHIPVDGTVAWEDDYEAVYTTIVLDYSDLDGVRRQVTVRDQEAEERYGISRVLPLSGGQMTPSAAAAFARAELARRTRAGMAVSVRRDWQRGLETRGGERPVWRVRAGEWLRVGDEPMQPITGVTYDQRAGAGEVRLGRPVSLSELGQWRRLVTSETAMRRGLNPVTRTPAR